jgi:hypothetical protein
MKRKRGEEKEKSESEHRKEEIKRELGDIPRAPRWREILDIDVEDMEKELMASGWKPRPEDNRE